MNYDLSETVTTVKNELRRQFSDSTYGLWFADMELSSLKEQSGDLFAEVTVGADFKADIVSRNYKRLLEELFSLTTNKRCFVTVRSLERARTPTGIGIGTVPASFQKDAASSAQMTTQMSSVMTSGTEDFVFHTEYTFENFIVGDSNKFAHAACLAVANTPGSVYNPLFIYGHSGLGKTHLMYAVTNELKRKNPTLNVVYTKCEDFTNQLIAAISERSTQTFREKFRRADVLLIDDVQFVAGKTSTQEELFHTFNTLYDAHKQIIFTSDRPARDIKLLEDRIKTRCEWGLIADIQPPDPELRAAIIKKKAEAMSLSLSSDVVGFLADKLKSNVRQIEGTLKRLSATSFVSGGPVTLDMAARCIADIIPEEVPTEAKVERVLSEVSSRYGVESKDIIGKSRMKNISWARHIAVYVLRKKTDLSLPAIGKIFGRDHSTIVSSIGVIDREIESNPAFAVEINDLLNDIEI
ncbi:MAG: chromosomal replication initiator protein DnaA [Firmicutes bacterium]|nr:chromosomal replication initiator protein DnaA [Bacillota bacterium]MCD7783550.1 chromosomal replication initiator protein DnaA [Bacillota bacterium]